MNQYGSMSVSEGSIYPLLLRMQIEKSIKKPLKTSNLGPKHKHYHLTKKGLEQLDVFKANLGVVSTTVNQLLGGGNKIKLDEMARINNKKSY